MGYILKKKIYLDIMVESTCEKVCERLCRSLVNFFVYFKFITIDSIDELNQQKRTFNIHEDKNIY